MNLADYTKYWTHLNKDLYIRFLDYYNESPKVEDRERLFHSENPYGLNIKLKTIKG